jgi:hypothetical protein
MTGQGGRIASRLAICTFGIFAFLPTITATRSSCAVAAFRPGV